MQYVKLAFGEAYKAGFVNFDVARLGEGSRPNQIKYFPGHFFRKFLKLPEFDSKKGGQ
jgi:hypothetical protein